MATRMPPSTSSSHRHQPEQAHAARGYIPDFAQEFVLFNLGADQVVQEGINHAVHRFRLGPSFSSGGLPPADPDLASHEQNDIDARAERR